MFSLSVVFVIFFTLVDCERSDRLTQQIVTLSFFCAFKLLSHLPQKKPTKSVQGYHKIKDSEIYLLVN